MKILPLAATLLVLTSANAFALTIDQNSGTKANGAANLGDPDDNIPFPHVSDDGMAQPQNFEGGTIGNTGVGFGFTGSNAQPDGFQRAQERQMQ